MYLHNRPYCVVYISCTFSTVKLFRKFSTSLSISLIKFSTGWYAFCDHICECPKSIQCLNMSKVFGYLNMDKTSIKSKALLILHTLLDLRATFPPHFAQHLTLQQLQICPIPSANFVLKQIWQVESNSIPAFLCVSIFV